MNKELIEAIRAVASEKGISEEILFDAVETSLKTACRNHFKTEAENVEVSIDRENGDYHVYVEKTVVETPEEVVDDFLYITLEDAQKIAKKAQVGDLIKVEYQSKEFGRIATQNAKNTILQRIREEERSAIYNSFRGTEKSIVEGKVQRIVQRNLVLNLGKADAILNEKEMVKGEHYRVGDRVRVYVLEVKSTSKGPRILVSRTHPDFVKALFEKEVDEIKEGIVEIKRIAREPGSRTKIAVYSNDPSVDPVGACVGIKGARVNSVVDELGDEKIDIVNWDENPGNLIQNALSPAQTVAVFADPDEKSAKVVVPDDQLSLAIGKEGQNARLAAKLTDYKIDIKSESQAVDAEGFRYSDYFDDEEEYGYDENVYYDENGNPIYDESAYVDDGSYAVEDTEEASAEDVVAEGDGTEGSDE